VAATGFLPGILSFLCALSHLEGVAHRSINLFFQLQPPLSPGESVVQTGQQATQDQTLHIHHNQREIRHEHPRIAPDRCNSINRLSRDGVFSIWQHGIDSHSGFSGMRDESSTQGSMQTPRFRTEKGVPAFPNNTDSFPKSTQASRSGNAHTGFLRARHRLLNHRDARRFSTGVGLVVLSRAPYAFRQSGRMEEEPFSRLTLAILFACVRVDTCHPWNCMRSTSTHHPCTSSLAKNLG
jgi:hypothetical protein